MNGRRVRRRGGDHHRVVHGAVLPQGLHGVGHRRALLADGHVDALHVLALLVQDRVHGDGGLTGLAVADDELPLAPADGDHGVDGLDAGLQRLVHGLAAHDARRLDLDPAVDAAHDRALAVDRFAQRVDHAAEQGVAHGDGEDAAGRADGLALLDAVGVPQDDGADRLLVQVEGQADRAVLELQQLVDRGVGQAGYSGDAVAHLGDPADGLGLQRGLEALQVLRERGGDVRCGDGQLCHGRPSSSLLRRRVITGGS